MIEKDNNGTVIIIGGKTERSLMEEYQQIMSVSRKAPVSEDHLAQCTAGQEAPIGAAEESLPCIPGPFQQFELVNLRQPIYPLKLARQVKHKKLRIRSLAGNLLHQRLRLVNRPKSVHLLAQPIQNKGRIAGS